MCLDLRHTVELSHFHVVFEDIREENGIFVSSSY